jgi:hypothetical protein
MLLLTESPYPDSRAYAVEQMAASGEPVTPAVAAALVQAAGKDRSGLVRAACVRGICRLQVEDPSLPGLARKLQTDSDPQVRQAARDLQQWMRSR